MDESGDEVTTRAGYVALVGYPNAGKSSLMNRLVEQKLSIVTPLAQTTREKVLGIDTRDGVQMVFVDTPGLVEPRYLLHRAMLHAATEVIGDSDVVLLLIDASAGIPEFSADVLELLARAKGLIAVSNKQDLARPGQQELVKHWTQERFGVDPAQVSALTGEGVDALRDEIARRLPVSPFLFPEDDVSSQPVRFFVAEFVREAAFELFEKEVPYSIAVKVDEFRETATPLYIRATIYVERPTQKAILTGQGGAAIKKLGRSAREKIEEFVGAPVYLDLWVKVLPRWRKDALQLQRFGFSIPTQEERT
ncbi:MAG: GTP-binding protein Era [uncultured Gemmatimonadetes bacterium]|uniref:GTPase Era n=1 Tax=uncultured Gemmatimonadota bacterium TaxID=203437 RepID=A0A6J4MAF7_9BACT|nr:MAG: GTP-binding protein Era [uncultured Gemmatimonadota bacterium]